MTTTLDFLDAMGRATALPAHVDFTAAVERLDIDGGQRRALLSRDAAALNRLLHGRPAMTCLVMTPDSEDAQDPDATPDQDPAETETPDTDHTSPARTDD